MNRYEELLNSVAARPSMVVHLGAGSCNDHVLYESLHANQIVFVEADTYFVAKATRKFRDRDDIAIINAAVSVKDGSQKLNVVNNRRFSSLLELDGLREYFPNIEVTRQLEVETMSLTSLCQHAGVNLESDNLLVSELQGLETLVFSTAGKEDLLKFKWILIGCGNKNLYKQPDETTSLSIQQTMETAGYTVLTFDEASPPFQNLLCIRNDAAREAEAEAQEKITDILRAKDEQLSIANSESENLSVINADLKSRMVDLEKENGSLNKNLEKIKEQAQGFRKKIRTQQKIMRDHELHNTNLAEELDKSRTEAQASLEKTKTQRELLRDNKLENARLTKELKRSNDQIQHLTKEAKSLKEKTDGIEQQKARTLKELTKSEDITRNLSKDLDEKGIKLEELNKNLKDKDDQFAEIQQALLTSNKLLLKSKADLKNLQLKYKQLFEGHNEQNLLLSTLKTKLGEAQDFFAKLDLQDLVRESKSPNKASSGSTDH